MQTTDKNLDPNESLDIIAKMIHQAKGNVRNNAIHFLLWGWVVALAYIGMYILIQTGYSAPYIVWVITIPAAFLSMYFGFKHDRKSRVTTHLDKIYTWLWITFGITIFTIVGFGYKIDYQFNSIILLITSIPTLLSGISLRFKPLIIGGILFWVFGVISFMVNYQTQLLVGAVAIICGYLIPGYMLRNKKQD
jgi:MFS family permease